LGGKQGLGLDKWQTKMDTELSDFTWHSLYEHIESRITGIQKGIQIIKLNNRLKDLPQPIENLEYELERLQWCLPLVREMQAREDMQVVCPIMSVNMIRLRCRANQDNQAHSFDFAWISAIADGRFSVIRLETNESRLMAQLWSFEGNLPQTVEKIETLVKELCHNENR